MGLLSSLILGGLPLVPTFLMRRLSARYIAGETLEEGLAALTRLKAEGFPGILDVLGEDVASAAETERVVLEYSTAARALAAAGLDAYISIKPTHLGLRLSRELAERNYARLAKLAAELGLFVRVEMEDHTTTDETLLIFRNLRQAHPNTGIVLQSRLLRTPADIEALPPASEVRLVKGIYLEPRAVALTEAAEIRRAYLEQAQLLLTRGHRVSLATHDGPLGDEILTWCRAQGVSEERFEFQVLMGVQENQWRRWRDQGVQVRVYVPFGREWRAYSTRRLRKNPAILGHVLKGLLGRG